MRVEGDSVTTRVVAGFVAATMAVGVTLQAQAPATGASPLVPIIVAAAMEQTRRAVTYDGSYRAIPYPNGDVPAHLGVCTDVIIRAYRAGGIDLQRLVHEDMRANFSRYPQLWGLKRPDRNIDHRRVPNLQTYFARQGASLRSPGDAAAYQPGDVVSWMLPGNLPHIGIVASIRAPSGRPMLVHNIGRGPQVEDVLLAYPRTGHYRFHGPR